MATGWSTITSENTNFARLCKLLIDGGTHALKVIFDAKHPPHDLKKHLMDSKIHNILKNLKAKKILRSEQWNRLYPTVGSPTSAGFDITLLSLLLRNICNLPTPANGWNKEPAAASVNMEDDVVRLRLHRNNLYGHISEPALSNADFNKYWNDIETVLLRHGVNKTAIDSLKTQSFEPEDEDYYIKCLKEWITDEADRVIHEVKKSEKRVLDEIDSIKDKLSKRLKPEPSKPATPEDMELYSKKLKKSILKQAERELQPKGIIQSMKTDDIFTNLIVHHGKKRCPKPLPEQIQRPHGYHPDRKTLTEIKQCSEIFVDEDEKDTTVKRILLSGEPGIGKTLFSQKLLRDLSTNSISIPEIKFTYLITFRQLNNLSKKETLNLRELLNLCPLLNDGSMIDENVMDYILQHPEQLLIVLDGFDQYKDSNKMLGDFESQFPNDSKSRMPVAALLSKLFRKKILADAVIMVTSSPSEANVLDNEMLPDHYVEITGFSESEIIAYVKKYFSTKPEEVKNIALGKIEESEHYISFGRVPFRCLLMCVLIEWKIKKHDNSCPYTLTELYFQAIQCIENNYNKAILSFDDKAASLAVDKTLDNFSKLAALLAEQHRFSFTSQDLEHLKLSENELLYIKSSNLIFCYPVSSNNLPFQKPICEYSFTHFAIQEFFVARYLVKKGVMAARRTTEMVYTFMSGLLGLDDNNELMVELLECLGKHIKGENRLRLVSLRCLHEFGQEKRFTRQELNTNRDYRYWSTDGEIVLLDVTDTDCPAIAMLVESTATSISSPPHVLSIFLSPFTSSGLRRLLSSLILCSISTLILSYCELNDECAIVIAKDLPKTKLSKLDLSCNRMTDIGVDYIINHISSNLNFLDLSGNLISDEYAERTDAFFKENYPGLTYRNFLASKVPSRVAPEIIAQGPVAERLYQKPSNYRESYSNLIPDEYAKRTDDFSSKVLSRLPPEIIAQGPVSERSYRKALEHGEVKIYRGCVKIIGQDRAGKTSLKRSLCGFPFNPEEESTVGVEVSLCTPVTMNDVKSWQIKETDEGIIVDDDIVRTMAMDIEMQGLDLTEDKEGDDDGIMGKSQHASLNPAMEVLSRPVEQAVEPTYLTQQVSSENIQEVEQSQERKTNETLKDYQETENQEVPSKKILESSSKRNLQVSEVVKYLQEKKIDKSIREGVTTSLTEYLKEKKIDESIKEKEVTISIWDFAGQHLYYASHPVFMSHRAVYVLVYNLAKDLDATAVPRVRQGSKDILLDNDSNDTNLDEILSWMVSVHCLTRSHVGISEDVKDKRPHRSPPVLIVGTHADILSDRANEKQSLIDEVENKLKKEIQKREYGGHALEPYFAVDNSESLNDEGVQNLHKRIQKVLTMEPYIPESVPIRWIHFEKSLQVIVQEKKKRFMPLLDISKIAKDVCFIDDEDELTTMLNFYHDLGVISLIGGTVVLDIQWLIDVFKKLITIKPYDDMEPEMKGHWAQLERTGKLSTDLVDHVFRSEMDCGEAKEDLIHIMQHYGLIVPIRPGTEEEDYDFLVPSHLTSSPVIALKDCQPCEEDPCTLYIHFLDGFIPHGLFGQLVSIFCSSYGSEKVPKLYRNAAIFVLNTSPEIFLTLICCKSSIKIWLHSECIDKAVIEFGGAELKRSIKENLEHLSEKFPWYSSLNYDFCVRCPLCTKESSDRTDEWPFGKEDCLHPISYFNETYCTEKGELVEVGGLHFWYPQNTAKQPLEEDRQKSQELIGEDIERITKGMFENSTEDARSLLKELRVFVDKRREAVHAVTDFVVSLDALSEKAADDMDEASMFNVRVERIQKILVDDIGMMRRLDEMYGNLLHAADILVRSNPSLGPKSQIICSLLVADTFSDTGVETDTSLALKSASTVCDILFTGNARTSDAEDEAAKTTSGNFNQKILADLSPMMSGIFDGGVISTAKDAFGSASKKSNSSELDSDISEEVKRVVTTVRLDKDAKSETAKVLRDVAKEYGKQMQEIEELLAHLSSLAEDLEIILKKQFQALLESISNKAGATIGNVSTKVSEEPISEKESKYKGWHSYDEAECKGALYKVVVDQGINEDIEKVAEEVRRFIQELNFCVENRNVTLSVLRDIAHILEEKSDSVPAQTEIEEKGDTDEMILTEKVKKAQETLSIDRKTMTAIDDRYEKLMQSSENLCRSRPDIGGKDRLITTLIVADVFSQSATKTDSSTQATIAACTILWSHSAEGNDQEKLIAKIVSTCTPVMEDAFHKGVLESSRNVISEYFVPNDAQECSELAFDIHKLIHTLVELNDGSRSGASRMLRSIVQRYDEQLQKIVEFVQLLPVLAQDLESMLKLQSRNLLETISAKKQVDDDDEHVQKAKQFFRCCGLSQSWVEAHNRCFGSQDISATVVQRVAMIYFFLKPKLEQQWIGTDEAYKLTFIAHGSVRSPSLPSALNYVNDYIDTVTLYVPWGCLLDASAVYGISTDKMSIVSPRSRDIMYSGMVLGGTPRGWNVLPEDSTQLPNVVFNPVRTNEDCYIALSEIAMRMGKDLKGIVVPYFQQVGEPALPEVELWILCLSVAITVWSLEEQGVSGVKFRINIASCLAPDNDDVLTTEMHSPYCTVNCQQYRVVPIIVNDPVTMKMELNLTDENMQSIEEHINTINEALGIE